MLSTGSSLLVFHEVSHQQSVWVNIFCVYIFCYLWIVTLILYSNIEREASVIFLREDTVIKQFMTETITACYIDSTALLTGRYFL